MIEREVIDTRNREIIEKADKDIATVDPIVEITESVDVGDSNDDDDDLWA